MVGLGLAGIFLASLFFPIVAADHPQRIFADSATPTIVFDNLGGNEWWVEVKVTTSDPAYHVDRVEATDDGVSWTLLTLRSWGAWAGSFHIENGHEVQFRAAQHGGMSDAWLKHSCWFAHPSGQPERCSSYDATFRDPSGNEWWQQVYVSAPGGVSKVDVSINGGTPRPLTLRSWGAWANSYYAPGGSTVEFIATSPSGAVDKSGCYYWPLASNADCNQSGSFDVSFRNVRGNQYWVEADAVVLQGALAKVEYQVRTNTAGVCPSFDPNTNSYTCAPRPASKTNWGSYAASASIPPDSVVKFIGTSTSGETDRSAEYRWPPQ